MSFQPARVLKIFLLSIPLLLTLQNNLFAGGFNNSNKDSCSSAPDLIYYNGTIITMDPANPLGQAVAIRSDTITAVGSNEEIMLSAYPGCGTRAVDLNGLTMLPGFNDSHSHWLSWRQHICSVSNDTTYPSLEDIMNMFSANGWTSISELNFGRPDLAPEHLNNALDLDRQGKLSVRINGYWGTLDDGSLINILKDSMITPGMIYSDRIRTPGVKMYIDDPFGTADILSQQQTNQLVQLAFNNGWQVAAHAVNESAVEKILNAYEAVLGSKSNENYRLRIEHAVKVSDDQLNRMKQKGIIASFQLMGPPDWPDQFTFQTYISNTHPEWCLRWKDFVDAESQGLKITGSTDAPFNDAPCEYSPFRVIYQAVTRKGYTDRVHADWELAQRLSIEDCLKLLTIDGAYATFEENQKGSITAGKFADLVIVSKNPLEVSAPEELLDIKILLTMAGGQIEYCDDTQPYDLCAPKEIFIADSSIITASKYIPGQTPDMAFDNNINTSWGAGDYSPQWIQIKLKNQIKITGIDLVVDQWPSGETIHQIWAKGGDSSAEFELLHEFDQNTEINQTLNYTAAAGLPFYQYFRIVTTQSPSWIAWKEIKIYGSNTSAVDLNNPEMISFSLMPNYPNPFNPRTIIKYSISDAGPVSLKLFDVLGREAATLVDEFKNPGNYQAIFNGSGLSSGIYIYRLAAGRYSAQRKLILLK